MTSTPSPATREALSAHRGPRGQAADDAVHPLPGRGGPPLPPGRVPGPACRRTGGIRPGTASRPQRSCASPTSTTRRPRTASCRSSPTTCPSSSTRSPTRSAATGRGIHLVVHPQLVVRRDEAGRLLEILDIDVDDERPAGTHRRVVDVDRDGARLRRRRGREPRARRSPGSCTTCGSPCATGGPCARARSSSRRRSPPCRRSGMPAGGGRRGRRPAALARRRQPHLPRVPRVRAEGRRRRGLPDPGRRQRPGHPQHGRRPRGADGDVAELRVAAARRARAGPRARAARPEQGELAVHGAPLGVPRLHRRQDVRRRGQVDRRAPVPRPVLLQRLHAEHPRHPDPADEGHGTSRPHWTTSPARTTPRTCCSSWRPTRATSCSRPTTPSWPKIAAVGAAPAGAPAHQAVPAPGRLRAVHVLPGVPAARPLHDAGAPAHREAPDATRIGGSSVDYTARVSGVGPRAAALRHPRARSVTDCRTSTCMPSRRRSRRPRAAGRTSSRRMLVDPRR